MSDHAAGADARVQVQVVLYNSGPKLTKLVRGLDQLEPPDGGMTVRFLNNSPGDGCAELLTTLAPTFSHTYSDYLRLSPGPYCLGMEPRLQLVFGDLIDGSPAAVYSLTLELRAAS